MTYPVLLSSRSSSLLALLVSLACGCGRGASGQPSALAPGADSAALAHNLLAQSSFDDGSMLPWMTSFSAPAAGEAKVEKGELCVNVQAKGQNRWDAQVRHRQMTIQQGHDYVLSFAAHASRKVDVAIKVGMAGPPYQDYFTRKVALGPDAGRFSFPFKMSQADDATAELAFHFGGHMAEGDQPYTLCFDNVVLSDPAFVPPPVESKAEVPSVRVNQLGYLPGAAKVAVVVSDQKGPLGFRLLDNQGNAVFAGQTSELGVDRDSGDTLRRIDFSPYNVAGKGYVLEVGGKKSDPFDIDPQLYRDFKYDAFRYFYLNRSGIDIEMPFAREPSVVRPAGHPKDVAPCSQAAGCGYTLDVTGGWYDAGDYGKYVVNGGISVWTLLDWYERATRLKGDTVSFGDQKDLIPESGNKVPDVLDEARYELSFMLKMQVPDGQPNAGMVHHKIHDVEWTALGLMPHESRVKRELRPVSTAATLNLAAVLAQAARIWKPLDPAFAARCLDAATKAWAAAEKNPSVFAPPSDTLGGGPYDDTNVADEFYWAAAELWLTTGKAEYRTEIDRSLLNGRLADAAETPMTWQRVDTLGRISMAVVEYPGSLGIQQGYRTQLVSLANGYLELIAKQGYSLPLAAKDGRYPWGSNSSVLNCALVLGLAYDFTKDTKYQSGVVMSMDYLLGRNAMGQSYVTGYGERPLLHPHHRFWAKQANAKFPAPPKGAVSGGPNSGLEDPYVKAAGLTGCAPQKCFVDNIEAWSVNEVTINWNAPLFWVSAWLDEHAK